MNEKKQGGFKLIYIIGILVVVLLFCLLFIDFGYNGTELNQTEVFQIIQEGKQTQDGKTVKAATIYYGSGKGYILIAGSQYDVKQMPEYSDFYFVYDQSGADGFLEELRTVCSSEGVNVTLKYVPAGINAWDIVIPVLYIGFAIFVFWMLFRMISGANKGAMNFGKTKIKTYQMSKVRFSDIAGMDEEKVELQEIVEFLKNPKKFTDLGARIPKGVLLVGRPGTGKTLLARAVAGESRVPFISISGSDFVEMFVGVGASRVRDLFDQAKKNKPCIVFIDEIDAVGRQRGAGLGGGNDEREQTLNQLLVEMDGFETNDGIIVLAATNRSDILDPALMRPGRFDRQVYVHVPDVKGREGILKIHARNKPLDEAIDFNVLARITTGFTGADIENMLNEAAILAARAGRSKIIMEDITEGINKVIMGPQKKSRLLTEKERKLTAYHESGHAILAKMLKHCEDVQEVSIIPRGNAGGYTMTRPENDDMTLSLNKANDEIAMCMGGRLAEEIVLKDITSGASADIAHATKIAKSMVYDWGMSKKIGFMSLGSSDTIFIGRDYQSKNDFSEKVASMADEEIMSIMDKNYKRAKEILTDNIEILHEMAKLLLARETIYKEEVDLIIAGKKTEEIIKLMDEKDRLQKEKEQKIREEKLVVDRFQNYYKKVAEGDRFLAMGVISQEEYDTIKKEFDAFCLENFTGKNSAMRRYLSNKVEDLESKIKNLELSAKTGIINQGDLVSAKKEFVDLKTLVEKLEKLDVKTEVKNESVKAEKEVVKKEPTAKTASEPKATKPRQKKTDEGETKPAVKKTTTKKNTDKNDEEG